MATHPDDPLLLVDPSDDRGGLAAAWHRGHAADVEPAGTLFRKYGYHFTSLVAIAVFMVAGMSAFRAVFWATVLAVALSFLRRETRADAAPARRRRSRAARRRARRLRHDGHRRHHRRRRDADRARAEDLRPHRRARRRPPVPDRRLLGARGLDARAGRAGHRVVHHRRRHGRAGARPGRRLRRRRAHVHLLLRRAVRGQSADRALAVRRRGDHRRQSRSRR